MKISELLEGSLFPVMVTDGVSRIVLYAHANGCFHGTDLTFSRSSKIPDDVEDFGFYDEWHLAYGGKYRGLKAEVCA